jgi:ABC-2 type transport system ATP-binding protein
MIEINNLVKDYDEVRAVDHISFSIPEGEIVGFLGPNGAGKSTTLKMLTCYISPTKGNASVDNFDVYANSKEVRKLIGYLPEHNPLYLEMTVYDYLGFVADAREIPQNQKNTKIKSVVERCGLREVVSRPIQTLSKGYRQRVGLAQAIIHDPKILILDEPTTGLDPNQIIEIRQLIKKLGREKTVIISSHIMQEVQAVSDRIIIINKGKIVADAPTAELQASFEGKASLTLEVNTDLNSIKQMELDINDLELQSATELKNGFINAKFEYAGDIDPRLEIFGYVKEKGWGLVEMKKDQISLEDVFRKLTVEETEGDN